MNEKKNKGVGIWVSSRMKSQSLCFSSFFSSNIYLSITGEREKGGKRETLLFETI